LAKFVIRKFNYIKEFHEYFQIEHIIIGHNGKNPGAGWFLDWVEIDVPAQGRLYR
jgi:hypothetical protein